MESDIERLNTRKNDFLKNIIEDFKIFLIRNMDMITFKSVLDFDDKKINKNVFYDNDGNSFIFVGARLYTSINTLEIGLIGYSVTEKKTFLKFQSEYNSSQILNIIGYIEEYNKLK